MSCFRQRRGAAHLVGILAQLHAADSGMLLENPNHPENVLNFQQTIYNGQSKSTK